MTLNLTKTYSQRSNALRDVRKAIGAGEYARDALDVVVVPTGYQIVLAASVPAPDWSYTRARFEAEQAEAQKLLTHEPAEVAADMETLRTELQTDPLVTIGAAVLADRAAEVAAAKPAKKASKAAAPKTPKAAAPKTPKAPKTDGLGDDQIRLLNALVDCKALTSAPIEQRVGLWVRSAAVHDSETPHNLPMRQVPGVMGALRRRGLVECGWDKAATVRLTQAGLDALLTGRAA